MSKIRIGKVRPVERGAYNSARSYESYDYVLLDGSAWLARKAVPAGMRPDENPDYWVLFGAKGEQGKQGEKGDPGDASQMPVIDTAVIDNLF